MSDIREEFERWIGAPPYEHMCDKGGGDSEWPGQYKRYETQLVWEAYQAGRAAGGKDAEDELNAWMNLAVVSTWHRNDPNFKTMLGDALDQCEPYIMPIIENSIAAIAQEKSNG